MKTKCRMLLFALLVIGCKSNQNILEKVVQKNTEYKPVDPFEYGWNVPIVVKGPPRDITSKLLQICTNEESFSYLMDEGVLVSILQQTAEGEVNLGPAALSSENTYYRVVMDYSKHRTVTCSDKGSARIGIGLRLVVKLFTSKNKVNLGDLFAIGVAAQAGRVQGTLSIEVIGIKSSDVTNLLPMPSEINPTSIQNAMMALASIKTKIYDQRTEIYPQVIAIKPSNNSDSGEVALVRCLSFLKSSNALEENSTVNNKFGNTAMIREPIRDKINAKTSRLNDSIQKATKENNLLLEKK